MLTAEKTVLIVVDVQGKLAHSMSGKEDLFRNLQKIIKGIRIMGIPILWVEQNPDGLGPTIPEVADLLSGVKPIKKLSFSCCQNDRFLRALEASGCNQVLVVGIEAHICVYQTAVELLGLDYDVQVVVDAVASRVAENKTIALSKMKGAGVDLTSTEMALFELLRVVAGEKFKEILKIVR